ncbi:MAG: hypothetical protein ACHQRM_04495 [Bacteroidia bacterium]
MIRTPKIKINRAVKTDNLVVNEVPVRKETRYVVKHRVPEKSLEIGSRG